MLCHREVNELLEFQCRLPLEAELLNKGVTYAYDVLGSAASHKEGQVCWDEQLGAVFQDKYLQISKPEKGTRVQTCYHLIKMA